MRVGVYTIRIAIAGGNRNHKNNNHIIVFNNEKYHFRHNFWLLFVQAKKFFPALLTRVTMPAFWLAAGGVEATLKYA